MDRRNYIGSSDARRICSGDPAQWEQLRLEKFESEEPENLDNVFQVQLGKETEEFHIRWLDNHDLQDIGWEVDWDKRERFKMWELDDIHLPLGSHVDAMCINQEGTFALLEVKHLNAFTSLDDQLEAYMPQLMHHMFCHDIRLCIFSAIRGNSPPAVQMVEWSKEYWEWQSDMYKSWNDWCESGGRDQGNLPEMPSAPSRKGVVTVGDQNWASDWFEHEEQWMTLKVAKDQFNSVQAAMKDMMPADAAEVRGKLVKVKADKRGALRFSEVK